MRFRMLGPLQAWDGADWSVIRAAQQRVVLAVLLTEAGRMVTTDRLTDEIWGEHPPKTAASVVQGYVMRLRRLLGGVEPSRLATHDRGYQLMVDDPDLDARVFEQLAESGKRSLADGDLDAAASRLAEALALWRGPAMDDVPSSPTVTAEAARLEQCRLDALEARLGTELALGRHADVVGELRRLVGEHPLREELRAQLMLALYRSGRRAEALEVYRGGRRLLVDELGLEPGPRLRELEHAMLADDPRLATPVRESAASGAGSRVTLRQAPADVAGFTGRDAELRRLDSLLPPGDAASRDEPPRAGSPRAERGAAELVICTIAGPAGVGKTALAVHWAHRVEGRFPDGQLYANLRGYAASAPLRPLDALARFLGALGVPAAEVPVEEEEAAALYRSLLAGKRMLVLLDNAQHADQVRPLLPGGGGSLVLVTSRDQFGGLVAREGAVPLTLDVLATAEALALLARLLGPERVGAEPAVVAELARLCGCLPLALRIAAANVLTHPGRSLEDFTARLRTGDRLAMLEVDGDTQAAVRSTFDLSYFALPAESRRLFRLLGLVPGPDIAAEGAAALAGLAAGSSAESVRLLDRLVRTHLVDEPAPGRYALHDLLRLYAAERAADEETENERQAALRRLFDHYLSWVDAAAQVLYPDKLRLPPPEADRPPVATPFGGQAPASAWIEAERPNLTAAVHHAAGHGPQAAGWRLADALRGYFDLRRDTVDWPAVARSGLLCAQADGDERAKAAAHLSLALFHWNQTQYRPAIDHYTRARDLSRETGWLDGHATALANLGIVHHELGQLQQAADHYRQALAIHQRTGYLAGQGSHLGNLGECYHGLGRLDDALAALTEARDLRRKVGARAPEADALRVLAAVHRDAGRKTQALNLAGAAVVLARDIGDLRFQADALNTLATIRHHLGHHPQAVDDHREALRIARDIGSGYAVAEALIGLAAAHRHTGGPQRAADEAGEALEIARRAGSRLLEGQCLTGLAAIHLDRGDHEAAHGHAQQALAIHAETGHRLGQARAHLVAYHALRACDCPDQSHERRALALFTEIGADWRDHARTLIRQA